MMHPNEFSCEYVQQGYPYAEMKEDRIDAQTISFRGISYRNHPVDTG